MRLRHLKAGEHRDFDGTQEEREEITAANTPATTNIGSEAVSSPRVVRDAMIRTSTTEDRTSQRLSMTGPYASENRGGC